MAWRYRKWRKAIENGMKANHEKAMAASVVWRKSCIWQSRKRNESVISMKVASTNSK
jgi:hypothetical protein